MHCKELKKNKIFFALNLRLFLLTCAVDIRLHKSPSEVNAEIFWLVRPIPGKRLLFKTILQNKKHINCISLVLLRRQVPTITENA